MDVRRTNSINLDNDFAKDFLQISRKVTLGSVHPETPVFRGKDIRSDYHLVEKTLWQSQ